MTSRGPVESVHQDQSTDFERNTFSRMSELSTKGAAAVAQYAYGRHPPAADVPGRVTHGHALAHRSSTLCFRHYFTGTCTQPLARNQHHSSRGRQALDSAARETTVTAIAMAKITPAREIEQTRR